MKLAIQFFNKPNKQVRSFILLLMRIPVICYSKITKSRIRKISQKYELIHYVSEHPLCKFQDIYHKSKITTNWKFLRKCYDEAIIEGSIVEFFNKQCYVEPIPKHYKIHLEFLQKLDKVMNIIIANPKLLKTQFGEELFEHYNVKPGQTRKSKLKKSLLDYKFGQYSKMNARDLVFSKFFKLFLLEEKILTRGIKHLNSDTATSSINSHLDGMIMLLDDFEIFLKKYDSRDSEYFEQKSCELDVLYDAYKHCMSLYNGGRNVTEKVMIVNDLSNFTKGYVAKKHGLTSKRISDIVSPITVDGHLDTQKVNFYQIIESATRFVN